MAAEEKSRERRDKSVLEDKKSFTGGGAEKLGHMGDKPKQDEKAKREGSLDESGQGKGQSRGKPQTPPQE
jgi:hypothetical protein